MKGIELPINVLIIVAVAIIVLIALVALFYPNFRSSGTTVNSDIYKSAACQIMIDRHCDVDPQSIEIANFDADKDGQMDSGTDWTFGGLMDSNCGTVGEGHDNLASLCECFYSIKSPEACRALCGCSI